ncbi:MAG: pseudouridine synthase [Crocinitomicaceae bacterium]|nr:pseudouridine synthase [Crocinitomicaceae bacterium]
MSQHKHYILHKPFGYQSQFVSNAPKNHKQKFLGELFDFAEGTMSIGRLDEKSEGLLLLTTDGKVSNAITSTKFEKEYYVQVDGLITQEAIAELEQGVEIGIHGKRYMTFPAKARCIDDPGFPERSRKVRDDRHGPTSWASITIREGKFRQVRKMCAAVGFPVLRLIRVRIGDIHLGDLSPGEAKQVDGFEGVEL